MNQDIINACFECVGVLAAVLNFRRLKIDRRVAGISPVAALFFTLWGIWNLYYYAHLSQPISQAAAGALTLANAAWLALWARLAVLAK